MKWSFTPGQVAKGDVDYTLEQFRADLEREVRDNFDDFSPDDLEQMFNLAYDVCYCVAVRHDLVKLAGHCRKRGLSVDTDYLKMIADANSENIDMLKAVFARKVAGWMGQGLTREQAVEKLDEFNRSIMTGETE